MEQDIMSVTRIIKHNQVKKSENNIELICDLIDTPGYGSFKDIDVWYQFIKNFIRDCAVQYHKNKKERSKNRKDTRIHLCLYFIEGPACKESDLKIMYELQRIVNIIPILAKADSYTYDELIQAKLDIIQQLALAEIAIFDAANSLGSRANELTNCPLCPCPPFALISCINTVEYHGDKKIYGRRYPWGICDINNPQHSDFALLNKLLISSFLSPARDATKDKTREILKLYKQEITRKKTSKSAKSDSFKIIASVASVLTLGLLTLRKKFV